MNNTISDYTIYCSSEQTRKAFELGAKINIYRYKITPHFTEVYDDEYAPPITAEQMCGWLRDKGLFIQLGVVGRKHQFQIDKFSNGDFRYIPSPFINYDTYEQATIAAIDAALDYLEKGGNNESK